MRFNSSAFGTDVVRLSLFDVAVLLLGGVVRDGAMLVSLWRDLGEEVSIKGRWSFCVRRPPELAVD